MDLNSFTIDYDYPGIFLLIATIIIFFLVKLYYSGSFFTRSRISYLFVLKFISMFLLLLLVFNPSITYDEINRIKKRHLFLIDNSESILFNDSTSGQKINNFLDKNSVFLSENKNIEFFIFGDSLFNFSDLKSAIKFNAKFSDLSLVYNSNSLFKYHFLNKYYKSVTIISDGNFNNGTDFTTIDFNSLVNCISVGKDVKQKDLLIDNIIYEKEIILNQMNQYEITAQYKSNDQNAENDKDIKKEITLSVFDKNDKKIKSISKKVLLKDGLVFKFKIELTNKDLNKNDNLISFNKLKFRITELENEKNIYNNETLIYQKVVNDKNKIIIFCNAPDLNLHFLKYLLTENNLNFQLFDFNNIGNNIKPEKVDLGIFINFPNGSVKNNISKYIEKINNKLVFLTEDSDKKELNNIFSITPLYKNIKYVKRNGLLEDFITHETSFLYSLTNSKVDNKFSNLELLSFDNIYAIEYDDNFQLDNKLFTSVLKTKSKPKDIISISKNIKNKIAFVNINSIWKLIFAVKGIIQDENSNNTSSFKLFLINLITYLSNSTLDEYNKILPTKEVFYSGENIEFKGKIFDKNFLSLDNEKVKILLKSTRESSNVNDSENFLSNKEYYFNFSSDEDQYELAFNLVKPGYYEYEIVSVVDNNSIVNSRKGNFRVIENNLERGKYGRNLDNLTLLTSRFKGKIYGLDSLDYYINNVIDFSEEEINSTKTLPVTKNMYYFFLIIFFFIIEWISRKIKGFL